MIKKCPYIVLILMICLISVSCHKSGASKEGTKTGDTIGDMNQNGKENNKDENTMTSGSRDAVSKVVTKDPVIEDTVKEKVDLTNSFAIEKEEDKDASLSFTTQDGVVNLAAIQGELMKEAANGVISETQIQECIDAYTAGTIIDINGVDKDILDCLFYSRELSKDDKLRMEGKSYGENCDIPYSELRYLRVLHMGFDGRTHIGEMVVNKAISEDIIDIFKELYEAAYKVERMLLVDEYNADDNASMEDNNTSSFNYRKIAGSTSLSLHSYGLAIDINPLYNPYIKEVDGEKMIQPDCAEAYSDRARDCEYYINKDDICYKAFTNRGFSWGGDWMDRKDYQHFQKSPK